MQVRLPRSPSSAHLARVSASEFLAQLGRTDLQDGVTLIASELVANAVMHAKTDMSLSIELAGTGVRIAVTDASDALPRWTLTSRTATSGRGLVLVQQLSRRWGVDPLPGGGKCVWAEVDAASVEEDPSSPDDLLELWSDEPWPAHPETEPVGDTDVAIEVDVQAMLDSRAHTDDLVRDLELTLLESLDADSAAVRSVVDLARRLSSANEDFYEPRRQMYNQTVSAAKRRQAQTTLRLRLHRDDVPAARRWLEALDEADAMTTAGTLLVPPFPPGLVAFRRAYIGGIIKQLTASA